ETGGNFIPVYQDVPSDLLTPVTAYLKLAHGSKYSFLLESAYAGETISRYSFIGASEYHQLSEKQMIEMNHYQKVCFTNPTARWYRSVQGDKVGTERGHQGRSAGSAGAGAEERAVRASARAATRNGDRRRVRVHFV
ncbi:anthranilate synthase component 1, partial [Coemansia sp. RSA 522]